MIDPVNDMNQNQNMLKSQTGFPGLELTEEQIDKFSKYRSLLLKWNDVMNLTAITEPDEINLKHFVDSLTITRVCDMKGVTSMIDVGTGAGFPGIPIKIMYPDIKVVLLDSLKKRIHFLDEVIHQLGLSNITTVHGRAEDYANSAEHREVYDLCVSRAVANLSTLSEYCIPFVKEGGYFVSYKSGNSENEIKNADKALSILGGKIEKTEEFCLPGTDMGRLLVKIKKVKKTPKKYPRKAGTPSRDPLS